MVVEVVVGLMDLLRVVGLVELVVVVLVKLMLVVPQEMQEQLIPAVAVVEEDQILQESLDQVV